MVRTTSMAAENTVSSRFFYSSAERELRLAGQRRERFHLGLGDLPWIDTRNPAAVEMHLHHDSIRFGRRLLKYALENFEHEFHRRVIVVEQDDLVEGRFFLLGVDPF